MSLCLTPFAQHYFVTFFHVLCVATVCLFSLLYSVPLYEKATIYLSISLLMVLWVVSSLGLL